MGIDQAGDDGAMGSVMKGHIGGHIGERYHAGDDAVLDNYGMVSEDVFSIEDPLRCIRLTVVRARNVVHSSLGCRPKLNLRAERAKPSSRARVQPEGLRSLSPVL